MWSWCSLYTAEHDFFETRQVTGPGKDSVGVVSNRFTKCGKRERANMGVAFVKYNSRI